MKFLLALLGGVATATGIMFLVFELETVANFNLFMFSLWGIIPIGAILVGGLCCSGVVIAAKALNVRPSMGMLGALFLLALYSIALFYWLSYQRDMASYGFTSADLSYVGYVNEYLSNLTFSFRRSSSAVPLGEWGKLFALIDLIGFMIGAWFVYFLLSGSDACDQCGNYLKKVETKRTYYDDPDEFGFYYNSFSQGGVSDKTVEAVIKSGATKADLNRHTLSWDKQIMTCKDCERFFWKDNVSGYNGKDWQDIGELKRLFNIPSTVIREGRLSAKVEDREAKSKAFYRDAVAVAAVEASPDTPEASQDTAPETT